MINRYDIECYLRDHASTLRSAVLGSLVFGIVAAAGLWWFAWRSVDPPSIFDDPVEDIGWYFASEDFNSLSVDERMRLIEEFAQRFRRLSQSESAVLSGFWAGLTGDSMEQLRENVRILARDILKDGAAGYFQVPPEKRAAYMDHWVVEWMKFGERFERGEERSMSDDERLAQVKQDAGARQQREAERAGEGRINEESAVRFMDFWRREVESVATPEEQGQIMKFMQDLRKHMGG